MGSISGCIFLVVGIVNLMLSIWRPGLIIVGSVSLLAGYQQLKGAFTATATPATRKSDEPTVRCHKCGTENLVRATVCRGCNTPLHSIEPVDKQV